ncbi:non-ribosomal peptide synthetase [Actinokineospora globicatena]|uniref:non-ribosomal peptide synthetase n=1 Tax=Actinokineospora globicatena TaxID=103729 RepID=UPI0020A4CD23|nr:non-ribosomal peptide synthetase [Actinokineospora globicatena]MCP2303145.1 amino acid adenylation domain-containing protein [Actinokineospora globicatena]GLW79741.1 hypothetical protein Aglo01_42220 [Actinokineospora globicatena]GLW85849.1 hypothetical protein Aglo02_34890 [Actinokineospora globicatena]
MPPEADVELVNRWNATAAPFPDGCLHEWFERTAATTPDAVAVIAGDTQLSYRCLDERANQVAHHLRRLGVGVDAAVGVGVPRSVDLLVCLLGVLKAGAAYLPLDLDLPDARLRQVVALADPPVCLLTADSAARLDGVCPVVAVDRDRTAIAAEATDRPETGVGPANLVSVYFTSGSTGVPKGVCNTHGGWVNRMSWMRRQFRLAPGESVLHKTILTFGDAGLELFWPLTAGGRVVMLAPGQHRDPAAVVDDVARYRSVYLQVVPSMLTMVLDVARRRGPWWLSSLRDTTSTGEALSPELVHRYRELVPGNLNNTWGATEVSIDSTHHLCTEQDARGGTAVCVGTPFDNNQVYVLDHDLEPVAIGEEGDLYIGGTGLARGYLADPVRTAAAFLPNPFLPGQRMYATGDRGSFRQDGGIRYAGRRDDQVKIRGMRVELGEVETALRRHPAVTAAAALIREDVPGRPDLVAYVVLDARAPVAELRAHVANDLPEHMVPRFVVVLTALPLNANLKVDRNALPAPEYASDAVRAGYAEPATEAERLVVEVFRDVLGIAELGVEDDFFAVGYSLLAVRVISRLREVAGDLPLALLYENRTARALAAAIEGRASTGAAPAALSVPGRGSTGPAPLTVGQEQLWFLHELAPDQPLYNEPAAHVLTGPLDVPALIAALRAVVAGHDTLRTAFVLDGDRPVQVVHDDVVLDVPVLDRACAGPDDPALLAELLELARTPFDLKRPCQLAARLYRIGDEEHVLFLNIHHIVSDGWSNSVFARELARCYRAASAGAEPETRPPAVRFGDFAEWQRSLLAGGALDDQLAYWRTQLDGAPTALALPSDRPRPADTRHSRRGARLGFELDATTSTRLRDLAATTGSSAYLVLLSTFLLVLHRTTGQDDVVVGTPMANRAAPALDELIGYFTNVVPIRGRYDASATFVEHLDRVRATVLAAGENHDVPLEDVLRAASTEGSAVQVAFAYQHDFDLALRLPGVTCRSAPLDTGMARYDLTLLVTETAAGTLDCVLEFATDMFERETAERLAGGFTTALTSALDSPRRPVAEHEVVRPSDLDLVAGWNATAVAFPDVGLHELFERSVVDFPDAVAVVCGDVQLSYRCLDEQANRIAHHLVGLGVAVDEVVGVCVPRSVDLLAVLLGVLKAGAAYLPLDPELPKLRLGQVLGQAATRVCVVDADAAELFADLTRTVVLDRDRELIACAPAVPTGRSVAGKNLVSVYFTSGSTGVPKGVASSHDGWVNRMARMRSRFGLAAGESVLHKTVLTFDDAGLELFWPLSVGARVVMLPAGLHQDPAAVLDGVGRYRSRYLQVVPSMLAMLLDVARGEGRWWVSTLRDTTSSGEALPAELVRRFRADVPWSALHNTWGATEVSIDSTHHECGPEDAEGSGVVSVGKPFDNNTIYVLDTAFQPVGIGTMGELYIGGLGLARGYAGDPSRTAEAFLPDPFVPGRRMYATGDRGSFRPDGAIRYAGRRDNQVKIRGMRVELGEVEAALRRHRLVRDAVAIIHGGGGGSGVRRLVAFVTARSATERPTPDEVRAAAADWLPAYMVPSLVLVEERLPHNANGKVDRGALVVPDDIRDHTSAAFEPCRGPAEEAVAEDLCELLALPEIGATDNFFQLGAHSLVLSRLAARLRHRFDIELPLRVLFDRPTVRGVAAEVEALLAAKIDDLSPDQLRALLADLG